MDKRSKLTINDLHAMKKRGEPIACLTAYDAMFAKLCEDAGVDVLLVGDSLGMVVQGHTTTIPVTLDDVIYHARCVTRVTRRPFVLADMPFMTAATTDTALRNAMRLMQMTHVHGVKIEVGPEQVAAVAALRKNGIPVCAHLGLRPQFIRQIGTLSSVTSDDYKSMHDTALRVVDQGVDLLLLECVPGEVADKLCEEVDVPVIGIGVKHACHGQISVMYDVIGAGNVPAFAHDFLKGQPSLQDAFCAYVKAVKARNFPGSNAGT